MLRFLLHLSRQLKRLQQYQRLLRLQLQRSNRQQLHQPLSRKKKPLKNKAS